MLFSKKYLLYTLLTECIHAHKYIFGEKHNFGRQRIAERRVLHFGKNMFLLYLVICMNIANANYVILLSRSI